jgi:RNA polymerase sigma-70 factor (TIGR02943 family)
MDSISLEVHEQDPKKEISEWVNSYGDTLFSWALYKTSNQEIAEDLVQETFLAAIQSYAGFKRNSSPKTWLFTILNNKITDYYRSQIKSYKLFLSEKEKSFFSLTESSFDNNDLWAENLNLFKGENENLLDNTEFLKILDLCLDHLPDNWKAAILAKYHLEKESQEICKELNISPSNYWQIIHRAKLSLRKCIEKEWV